MTNHIKRVTIDLPDTATAEDARQIAESIFAKLGACWADKTSGPIYDETGRHAANATVEQIPLDLQLANTRHREASTAALMGENQRLREALTPSGATMAAYIGEFKFNHTVWDPDGEYEIVHSVAVPWTTIKEIMAAIRARAALSTTEAIGGGEEEKVGACICDRACPMTEDRHWVNCPAHACHAAFLALATPQPVSEDAEWTEDEVRDSVKQVIDAPGWSHNTLARTVGISPAKLSEFLSGKRGAEPGIIEPLGFRWKLVQDAEASFTLPPSGDAVREALEWFSGQHRLSLQHYSPMYGDDDDQSVEWRVHRESGSINDREWEIVGRGETAPAAILAAFGRGEPCHG